MKAAPLNEPISLSGLLVLAAETPVRRGVFAGFTTRVGGVSLPPYHELNLATHVGDAEQAVAANRARVAAAVKIDAGRFVFAEQIHGTTVSIVDDRLAATLGGASPKELPQTDALVTRLTNTPLAILTADCVPVILADFEARVVGVVHAGWRGTAGLLAARTVRAMVDAGAVLSQLKAWIGPAVGPCCYEVGPDLHEQFGRQFGLDAVESGSRLDLARINELILLDTGLKAMSISRSGLCTACRGDLFFSWRRDGTTGRQAAVVALLDGSPG